MPTATTQGGVTSSRQEKGVFVTALILIYGPSLEALNIEDVNKRRKIWKVYVICFLFNVQYYSTIALLLCTVIYLQVAHLDTLTCTYCTPRLYESFVQLANFVCSTEERAGRPPLGAPLYKTNIGSKQKNMAWSPPSQLQQQPTRENQHVLRRDDDGLPSSSSITTRQTT